MFFSTLKDIIKAQSKKNHRINCNLLIICFKRVQKKCFLFNVNASEHSEGPLRVIKRLGTQRAVGHSEGIWTLGHSGTHALRTFGHLGHSDTWELRVIRHLGTWRLKAHRHSGTWALETLYLVDFIVIELSKYYDQKLINITLANIFPV